MVASLDGLGLFERCFRTDIAPVTPCLARAIQLRAVGAIYFQVALQGSWANMTEHYGDIYVLDKDAAVRRTLTILLSAAGYKVTAFAEGGSLLAACRRRTCLCILLEGSANGGDLSLLNRIRTEFFIPVIIFAGQANIGTAVSAMKSGAADFIEKPFHRISLLNSIECLARKPCSQIQEGDLNFPGSALLTVRERQVVLLLAAGLTNKEIARKLGQSPRTIEDKRSTVMRKLKVKNFIDLLHIIWRSRS